ncbi:MAG TPA: MFS transporter [Candidatus Eremiobacteraceae bacterium]|nr:MFS transporter [Candidatus Eremiobacteraceae bacterium]
MSDIAIGIGGAMSAATEKDTRREIAIRLLPFLFLLYIINFLDRSSVAYAAIGMTRDLGFDDRVFGLGFGIFFAGYILLQIPCAILVERWSARKVISITLVAWGAMTGLTALVHTPNELYVARFLLGAAEAGFFPGVVVYLSHWFVQEDRAKATSNFMSAIPLSLMIGSPIAGWILSRAWSGMAGWRWLFILEGLPAIFLGVVAYFFLTDTPPEAQWLRPEQRNWIVRRLREQKPVGPNAATIWDAFRSKRALILALIAFLNYSVFYTFIFWLPTMLKRQSGLADAKIGWLGAIPYLVCLVIMPLNGWHSDRHCERRWHTAVPLFIASLGLFGLATHPTSLPLAMLYFTMVTAGNAYISVFWSVPTEVLSPAIAAASVGLISSAGSVAAFAAPYAFGYVNQKTGSFIYSLIALGIVALIQVRVMFVLPRAAIAAKPAGET